MNPKKTFAFALALAAVLLPACGSTTTSEAPARPAEPPLPQWRDPVEPSPEPSETPVAAGPARLVLFDGYDATLYGSVDEGATWSRTGILPMQSPAIAALARAGETYVVTNTWGEVLRSDDQGIHWSVLPVAPWGSDGPGGGSAHFVRLDADSNGVLYAASAHTSRPGLVYQSSDGGTSWKIHGSWPVQTGMMIDLAVGAGAFWIAHPPYLGGQVFRSTGGVTFEEVGAYDPGPSGGTALVDVDEASGTLVAAGNPEVTFRASDDGGSTWAPAGAWIDSRAVQALATEGGTAFGVSVKGPVLRAEGDSWQQVGDWGTAATRDIVCCSGWIDLIVEH